MTYDVVVEFHRFDREDELLLSASEATEGCSKTIRVSRSVVCPACIERGVCASCSGLGVGCPACGGTPAIVQRCGGCAEGFVERSETITVVVASGTTSGARISVLGKGDARPGAPSGNLYFTVRIDGSAGHPYRASAPMTALPVRRVAPPAVAKVVSLMMLFFLAMAVFLYVAGR